MVATLLIEHDQMQAVRELLRPDRLPNGEDPEVRFTLGGVSWQRYLEIDRALGEDRAGPRLYFLDGDLEIMTTSGEHERIKVWLGDFVGFHVDRYEIEAFATGQATLRGAFADAGAEPDQSWCFHEQKEIPDLILEIALSSGGLEKLALYQKFGVPEVWLWRKGHLELYGLRADRSGYERLAGSRVLAGFNHELAEKCLAMDSWMRARRAFREGLQK
jgi:Uma2 family endonuclease